MGRACERRRGRLFISDFTIEADIGFCLIPYAGSIDFRSVARCCDRRQDVVIDFDSLGAVLGDRQCFRDNDCDRLSDMTRLVGRQCILGRGKRRHSVARDSRWICRSYCSRLVYLRLHAVGNEITAGQNRNDTRLRERLPHIDGADAGMRVWRSHEHRVGLAGE